MPTTSNKTKKKRAHWIMKMKTKRELCLRSQMAVFFSFRFPLLWLFISHAYKKLYTFRRLEKSQTHIWKLKSKKGGKEIRVRSCRKTIWAQMSRNDRQITVADSPAIAVNIQKNSKGKRDFPTEWHLNAIALLAIAPVTRERMEYSVYASYTVP